MVSGYVWGSYTDMAVTGSLFDCLSDCLTDCLSVILQLHLSTDEGCFFTLVECPLAEFGCQLRRVQRRDLSKHMADKHSHHMRILLGTATSAV